MSNPAFWKLDRQSDEQLLMRLGALLHSGRQVTAEVVAHLGEVEERRLHLVAACSSMFSYCVTRLGLSEDEACRRIEVARLARRFPALFPALARGEVSLSVAALLKPHLSESNHADLLRVVSGKSVFQAKECIAARFPRPELPSSVRRLPERTSGSERGLFYQTGTRAQSHQPSGMDASPYSAGVASREQTQGQNVIATQSSLASVVAGHRDEGPQHEGGLQQGGGTRQVGHIQKVAGTQQDGGTREVGHAEEDGGAQQKVVDGSRGAPSAGFEWAVPPTPRDSQRRSTSQRIEPLSAQRYRVQFTASAALKQKLELARDLMRHANPSGDFAPVIERALDLLLDRLMAQRFGKARRPRPERSATASSDAVVEAPAILATRPHSPCIGDKPQRISNATRRAVTARDGLQCSWVDDQGRRCESNAWLEHDHRQPRGKGGGSGADNVRILCRAHNCLAAEHEYGRPHMERARRRQKEPSVSEPLVVRDSGCPVWQRRALVRARQRLSTLAGRARQCATTVSTFAAPRATNTRQRPPTLAGAIRRCRAPASPPGGSAPSAPSRE